MVEKKKENISGILEFLCCHEDWKDEVHMFKHLDKFFRQDLETQSPLIVSLPESADSSHSPLPRTILDGGRRGRFEIESTVWAYCETGDKNIGEWHQFETDAGVWSSLKCGSFDGQQYLILLEGKVPESNSKEVFELLGKFIAKSFERVTNWKELVRDRALVYVDDVTGLYNQRRLNLDLNTHIQLHEEAGERFSLLFVDIDHFKNVNDGYGHIVGTKLLKELGKTLKAVLRASDLVYRYGGDEFIVLLPNTDGEVARPIGERILKAIKAQEFPLPNGRNFRISVSIGVAVFPEDARRAEDIISIADKMMYHAKASGRGKVCHASELIGTSLFKSETSC